MIGTIQLDAVLQQPNIVSLHWSAIPPIVGCRITYQVDFMTELTNLTRSTSELRFDISRDLFCFSMTVDIRGYAEGILGDPTRTTIQYGQFVNIILL